MDTRRIIASIDGAVIAFVGYLIILIILSVFGYDYHTFPTIIAFLLSPFEGSLVFAGGAANIAGMPPLMALANIGFYTAIGYTIDWFKNPYK